MNKSYLGRKSNSLRLAWELNTCAGYTVCVNSLDGQLWIPVTHYLNLTDKHFVPRSFFSVQRFLSYFSRRQLNVLIPKNVNPFSALPTLNWWFQIFGGSHPKQMSIIYIFHSLFFLLFFFGVFFLRPHYNIYDIYNHDHN